MADEKLLEVIPVRLPEGLVRRVDSFAERTVRSQAAVIRAASEDGLGDLERGGTLPVEVYALQQGAYVAPLAMRFAASFMRRVEALAQKSNRAQASVIRLALAAGLLRAEAAEQPRLETA